MRGIPRNRSIDGLVRDITSCAQDFLSFCQGLNCKFDTLPAAKDSSRMVLYHLHNPGRPTLLSTGKEAGVHPHAMAVCTQCPSNGERLLNPFWERCQAEVRLIVEGWVVIS